MASIVATATEITRTPSRDLLLKFIPPSDAKPPNGKVKAIVAAGGTFLCPNTKGPAKPAYYEKLFEFAEACNLGDEFQRRGLYQNDAGDYFLADGTQIVYQPLLPSIDSTEARSEVERLEIQKTKDRIKEQYGIHTDIITIQGTDTGAETAGNSDLIGGRYMDHGEAIVSSNIPASKPRSDGPANFWAGFDGTDLFKQVIVPSDNGRIIYTGNVRKGNDDSYKIYEGREVLAVIDMGEIRPVEISISSAGAQRESSVLPVPPTAEDYEHIAIRGFKPADPGNQTNQSERAAAEIEMSLVAGEIQKLLTPNKLQQLLDAIGQSWTTLAEILPGHVADKLLKSVQRLLKCEVYSGVIVKMSGSNNTPEYAATVLSSTGNLIPIYATSEVQGAKGTSKEGDAKYASAGILLAKRLGLNNWVELPATRTGPDMRPEVYTIYAAKYAAPQTPEFLVFCHLFAAFAWTSEDNDYSSSITGDRHDLVNTINRLELTKGKILGSNPNATKQGLSREILRNIYVKELLKRHIPGLVNGRGEYCVDDGLLADPATRLKISSKPTDPSRANSSIASKAPEQS